ncbi:MAG: hypothetical protein RBG13Loki_1352 [Promethearchaeota archaeon CR_4]|nr:MAG: hypothetical protein RBG13Loki_1352 [Candidatus Lokiarchaeota archaeon CR_4]
MQLNLVLAREGISSKRGSAKKMLKVGGRGSAEFLQKICKFALETKTDSGFTSMPTRLLKLLAISARE